MKTQLNRSAFRRGFNAAKRRRPGWFHCPYPAGSVAAASWYRGTMEHDTAAPQLRAMIAHQENELHAGTVTFQAVTVRLEALIAKMQARDDSARRIAEESYESEERHVRRIAELNRELRDAESRAREAQHHRYFVEDTAGMIERAREHGDEVEIDRLTEKLKRGW